MSFEPHDEPVPATPPVVRMPSESPRSVARPIILDTGRATAPRFRLLLPLAILVLLAGLAALIFLV